MGATLAILKRLCLRLLGVTLFACYLAGMTGPSVVAAQQIQGEFTFFEIPIPNAMPVGIAFDSGGAVYIAYHEANMIGRLDPATGQFQEFAVPTPDAGPQHLAIDSNDHVWFTEAGLDFQQVKGSKIARLDPGTGTITEYDLPTPESGPYSLAFDSQGRLWLSEMHANQVAEYNPSTGEFTEYKIRSNVPAEGTWPRNSYSSWPQGLTVDAEDNVWFALNRANKVVMLHPPSGSMIEYSPKLTGPSGQMGATVVRDPNGFYSGATRVTADASGNVWFTISSRNVLAKIDSESRRITEYGLPTPRAWPYSVDVDQAGRVWVNEHLGDKIAMFDPASGDFTEYDIPGSSRPTTGRMVAVDAEGRVWFSDEGQNRIGYVQ